MNFKELRQLVENWAEERGILSKATPSKQLLKTGEEILELLNAIEDEDIKEIEDAIGDIAVTLIIYSKIKGFKLFNNGDVLSDSKGKVRTNHLTLLTLYSHLLNNEELFPNSKKDLHHQVNQLFQLLNFTANAHNLKIWKCLESAYNIIKDRKGKMINGQFVKE